MDRLPEHLRKTVVEAAEVPSRCFSHERIKKDGKELWLIQLPDDFDFSELEGRKLRFRTPNDRGRVGKIRKVGEEKKSYDIFLDDLSVHTKLFNVFPTRKSEGSLLRPGKPFQGKLNIVPSESSILEGEELKETPNESKNPRKGSSESDGRPKSSVAESPLRRHFMPIGAGFANRKESDEKPNKKRTKDSSFPKKEKERKGKEATQWDSPKKEKERKEKEPRKHKKREKKHLESENKIVQREKTAEKIATTKRKRAEESEDEVFLVDDDGEEDTIQIVSEDEENEKIEKKKKDKKRRTKKEKKDRKRRRKE